MRRVAVYPGSFDPPTLGHMDLLERAARLYDELVVAVGINSSKNPLFSPEERIEILRRCTAHVPNVTLDTFDGLLVEYAHRKNAKAIVRGLRATADFEYEFQMAMVNRRLSEEVETVFLMTKWEHSYLSSSIVKEVAALGGDISGMVPELVKDVLLEAVRKR